MVLWIGFALLAAAVVWAVTRPLLTPPADAAAAADSELAVYRDQLAEIETERAQGLLGGAEAEGARVELARRLIQRSEEKQRAGAGSARLHRAGACGRDLCGSGAPRHRHRASISPSARRNFRGGPTRHASICRCSEATAADLVARVEAHLREHPEDGRGWDVLAPVYMRMGDFTQAADAFQQGGAAPR